MAISEDPRMKPVVRLMFRAAVCRANVLLVGESGVGKAYIARKIHENSTMARGGFRTVFCLPDVNEGTEAQHLVDRLDTLAGMAGTIYVRGIDLLSDLSQRVLLNYLDDREKRMKTCAQSEATVARLIFSSQRDLRLESARGRYLRQLYLRASVISIEVPPLRQRVSDIVSLARYFLSLFSHRECKKIRGLSNDAECLLRQLSWEGNIHELKNAKNRAVVLADDGQVLSAGVLRGVIREATA